MKDVLLLILGAFLGWVGQWLFYRYQQRDAVRQGPNIIVSKIVQHGKILFEIRNIGNDSLSEMDISVMWLEHNVDQKKSLKDFFPTDQDIQTSSPIHLELLGGGEKYLLDNLPQWSDDGLVNVEVTGFGVQSKRQYTAHSQIIVSLRQPT